MNKKNNIVCALIVLVFVVTCLTFAACGKNDDNIVPPAPADPTLITSFENVDDLYALTAIEIVPNDEYKLGVNSDKTYVSDGFVTPLRRAARICFVSILPTVICRTWT